MIAVDPEMLGQVFENLLASQNEDTGQSARKLSGAFYTPRDIVAFICKESLREYLYNKVGNRVFNQGIDLLIDYSDAEFLARKSTSGADLWGINSKNITKTILEALDSYKVLDPACGSGAFPMGMIQLLVRTYERLLKSFDAYELKLSIIENNIFGVDIEPMAIEISRLRAWLSVIIDEPDKSKIQPLPNLDFKFVCANSLISLSQDDDNIFDDQDLDLKLSDIRQKYFNARIKSSKDNWQKKYYELTTGKIQLWESVRSEQLKSFDPFIVKKPASFFDSYFMFGVHKFDAIIGNPPYVGTKKRSTADKIALENEFGFADDLYSHFFFKGIELLEEGGSLTYITSKSFWTIQSKKNLRDLLLSNTINYIFDTANPFESAMVDTAITSVNKNKYELENTIMFIDGSKNILEPIYFKVEQSTYVNTQNTVIFKPTKHNLKIYQLYRDKIKELNNMWWDKISTSSKIEQNKKELNEYRSNLKPGDIALLGCLSVGGVGLQTGNNGKYIAVRKSTKWAENIMNTRPRKLKNAINKYNITSNDLNDYSDPNQLLIDLDEYQIAELFDSIKEKYGRDVFGQGYLYRIIEDNEITDVDSLTDDEKLHGISTEKNYYVPYDKGDKDGNRWYLETPFAIAWSKENVSYLKTDPRARYQGYSYFFKEGFCWSDINTTYLKCRLKQKSINDVKSMSLYGLSQKVPEYYIISIINSKFMSEYVNDFVNNTQTFQINDARQLPIVVPSPEKLQELLPLFHEVIQIKKSDYSSQEDKARALKLIEDKIEDIILEIYQIK